MADVVFRNVAKSNGAVRVVHDLNLERMHLFDAEAGGSLASPSH